jgi:hypothetical protein
VNRVECHLPWERGRGPVGPSWDGPRMLSNAVISEAVAELVEERSKRAQLSADQIIYVCRLSF